MKQIKDIILETKKIKWVNILDLQPIDLKNDYHSEKTKQSIIENGFSRAIYVWLNPEDQQTYIIDGHLRTDLLKELVNDGYDVPDRLNCTFLDLPDKQTAIKYLLQVFNQKTNPISQKALGDWFDELDLSIPELNLQIDALHIELDDIKLEESENKIDNQKFMVSVECENEISQQELYLKLTQENYKVSITSK